MSGEKIAWLGLFRGFHCHGAEQRPNICGGALGAFLLMLGMLLNGLPEIELVTALFTLEFVSGHNSVSCWRRLRSRHRFSIVQRADITVDNAVRLRGTVPPLLVCAAERVDNRNNVATIVCRP